MVFFLIVNLVRKSQSIRQDFLYSNVPVILIIMAYQFGIHSGDYPFDVRKFNLPRAELFQQVRREICSSTPCLTRTMGLDKGCSQMS